MVGDVFFDGQTLTTPVGFRSREDLCGAPGDSSTDAVEEDMFFDGQTLSLSATRLGFRSLEDV